MAAGADTALTRPRPGRFSQGDCVLHRGRRRRTARALRWGVAAAVVGAATVGWPTAVPDPVVPPASGAAPRATYPPARPFVPTPTLAWERDLPGVTIRESSPVFADLGQPAVAVGALDAKVYAFSLADGSF